MVDPRDPRQSGDDQPLPPSEPVSDPYRLPPIRPPDEELTERYGPVAPEPKWKKPTPHFNRERFLLRCVAWIIGVQFSILILAAFACSYGYFMKVRMLSNMDQEATACPAMIDRIRQSAQESLAVLLALLGGGSLAASEINRRRDENDLRGRS